MSLIVRHPIEHHIGMEKSNLNTICDIVPVCVAVFFEPHNFQKNFKNIEKQKSNMFTTFLQTPPKMLQNLTNSYR